MLEFDYLLLKECSFCWLCCMGLESYVNHFNSKVLIGSWNRDVYERKLAFSPVFSDVSYNVGLLGGCE